MGKTIYYLRKTNFAKEMTYVADGPFATQEEALARLKKISTDTGSPIVAGTVTTRYASWWIQPQHPKVGESPRRTFFRRD